MIMKFWDGNYNVWFELTWDEVNYVIEKWSKAFKKNDIEELANIGRIFIEAWIINISPIKDKED